MCACIAWLNHRLGAAAAATLSVTAARLVGASSTIVFFIMIRHLAPSAARNPVSTISSGGVLETPESGSPRIPAACRQNMEWVRRQIRRQKSPEKPARSGTWPWFANCGHYPLVLRWRYVR
jgi:hypothetical protein